MKRILLSLLIITIGVLPVLSQHISNIDILQNEKWWGGLSIRGRVMPYALPSPAENLATNNDYNQSAPILISNKGRYVWSDEPFTYEFSQNQLIIKSDFEKIEVVQAGSTLKEAYLAACQKHFPPTGELPDELFFSMPQYNTWIELMYNQSEKKILEYAKAILENGFPAGVLMIDCGWQKYYGNFEFKPDAFPAPRETIDKLHQMGFKVMLWVCPYVSADSPEYRFLSSKGYLIRKKSSEQPAIFTWWDGQSACFDLTNPEAFDYFKQQLVKLQNEYNVDGFKLDAGDSMFYNGDFIAYNGKSSAVEQSEMWAKMGLNFKFNEYRACWKMAGYPLVQRLADKTSSWEGISQLIPDMLAAGLMGYAYTCPDMIGGGQYTDFINIDQKKLDQSKIIRSCQTHAMMPMMQFSVAPWRVLDVEHSKICAQLAQLHVKMGTYILQLAKESSSTGEPIVRHMEYEFPNQGYEMCKDQFMLGNKYLVAPMVHEGSSREVLLPRGKWKDDYGKIHKGGKTITINVPLNRLPWFEKIG